MNVTTLKSCRHNTPCPRAWTAATIKHWRYIETKPAASGFSLSAARPALYHTADHPQHFRDAGVPGTCALTLHRFAPALRRIASFNAYKGLNTWLRKN
jgi:hypothetical protein